MLMNIAAFVYFILGSIFVTIVVILVTVLLSFRRKAEPPKQLSIVSDELDRQRKENLHLKDELKRFNYFLASMIRLTSRLKPEEITQEIITLVTEYVAADRIAVFLSDEREKTLSIVGHTGLEDNWETLVYEVKNDAKKGKVGVSFETNLPISEHELSRIGLNEPYAIFNPDICYPLSYQSKKFGVIAISRKKALEENERNALGFVSNIAGIALNNIRSFADITLTAHTDQLTKLYNIAHFRQLLEDELNRARRFEHDISIVIVDLDEFKICNDTYGHQAGDYLLIQLAQILGKHFDNTDTLARYGGDEFIVMCPETKKEDAADTIKTLLNKLDDFDFSIGKNKVRVTFSAGVASYPDDGKNVTELIKAADTALYEAKGAGRNTVHVYRHHIETL